MYSRQSLSKYLDNLKHPLLGNHPGSRKDKKQIADKEEEDKDEVDVAGQVLDQLNFENSESSKLSSVLHQLHNS